MIKGRSTSRAAPVRATPFIPKAEGRCGTHSAARPRSSILRRLKRRHFFLDGGAASGAAGGGVIFFDSSTAGSANFTLNPGMVARATGGHLEFAHSSTAENSTIFVNGAQNAGGGTVFFLDDSSGGTANVVLIGNGTLDLTLHNPPGSDSRFRSRRWPGLARLITTYNQYEACRPVLRSYIRRWLARKDGQRNL